MIHISCSSAFCVCQLTLQGLAQLQQSSRQSLQVRPCSCNRVTRSTAFSAVPNAACRAQLNVCDAETDSATAAEEAEPANQSEFAHNTKGFSVEDEDAPPLPMVHMSLSNWSITAVRQLHICGLLAVDPPITHCIQQVGRSAVSIATRCSISMYRRRRMQRRERQLRRRLPLMQQTSYQRSWRLATAPQPTGTWKSWWDLPASHDILL